MKNKILLITGTTDCLKTSSDLDNTYEEVHDLTYPSQQRYAKKHGYDLLCLKSLGEDRNNIFKSTNLGILRALRCFDMLSYYDTVMWIDGDALITNPEYKIEDITNERYSLFVSWDWPGKHSFSTGNFILKNTDRTKELITTFFSVGKYVIDNNHWGEEQTTFNIMYAQTPCRDTIKILDHRFLNSIPSKELYRGIWDGRPDPPEPWTPESFLVHITGVPNKNRIDVLKNSFGKYL